MPRISLPLTPSKGKIPEEYFKQLHHALLLRDKVAQLKTEIRLLRKIKRYVTANKKEIEMQILLDEYNEKYPKKD